MSNKRVAIGGRPVADLGAESWIAGGDGVGRAASALRVDLYIARLTIDVTPELRGRIKIAAFRRGLTVADILRALLERESPDSESIA